MTPLTKKSLYIGLMSGTSVDAVDVALVDFFSQKPVLIATYSHEIPNDLQQLLLALSAPSDDELNLAGQAATVVGELFASAVNQLLNAEKIKTTEIIAIGSHGQTLRHYPNHKHPFTLQIGDPNIIAARTGITTVADFRRKDLAYGGQGAPLTPAFHAYLAKAHELKDEIVFLNLGGIANVTIIKNQTLIGFDTGPGNTLLDAWIREHHNQKHDHEGEWARAGIVNTTLLEQLLSDPYFTSMPPKSTGRGLFNLAWLQNHLDKFNKPLSAENIQATLTELTAVSIAQAIKKEIASCKIFVCGGGVYNDYLMLRLKSLLSDYTLTLTNELGIPPDWIEAAAFAWLAKQTMEIKPIDLRKITGASQATILGGIYLA